tara:strand:+ start:493 stop:636 length:144 start_codon:yes stop_codon:yes gene_type:complete
MTGFLQRQSNIKKITAEHKIMEGPAGVSIAHDMAIPKRTLRIPKAVE